MRRWQADYDGKNGRISTEYDCETLEELVEWLECEFAEELGGEKVDLGLLAADSEELVPPVSYGQVQERIERALKREDENGLVSDFSFKFCGIRERGCDWVFEAWSPEGENIAIEGQVTCADGALGEILSEVRQAADAFDVDEHVALWVPVRGRRGVPESVRALLADAEAIEWMHKDLFARLEAA